MDDKSKVSSAPSRSCKSEMAASKSSSSLELVNVLSFQKPGSSDARTLSEQPSAMQLITAAGEYAAARVAFDTAEKALFAAQRSQQPDSGQLCDELDAAADRLGATQQRVADLTVALTADGSLHDLSELLAAATAGRT